MNIDPQDLKKFTQFLYISASTLNNKPFKEFDLKKAHQDFKFKILYSKKGLNDDAMYNKLCSTIKSDLEVLLLLKIVYVLTFRDRLDQHNFKRTVINNIIVTETLFNNSFKSKELISLDDTTKVYLDTLIINNLYHLYKLKCSLDME